MIAAGSHIRRMFRIAALLIAAAFPCFACACKSSSSKPDDGGAVASVQPFGVYTVCEEADNVTGREHIAPNGERIRLCGEAFLTALHLLRASPTTSADGRPSALIQLTSVGEAILRDRSGQLLDRRIAIVVDGRILTAPVVMSPVSKLIAIGGTDALPATQVDTMIERLNTLALSRGKP